MEFLIFILGISVIVLMFKNNGKKKAIEKLKDEVKAVEENAAKQAIELEVERDDLLDWKKEIEPQIENWKKDSQLVKDHGDMAQDFKKLKNEIKQLNKEQESIANEMSDHKYYQELDESGVFSYKFKFQDLEKYDKALSVVREAQKTLIKNEKAFKVNNKGLVGSPIMKNLSKLCLTAFNSKCSELVNLVKYNNYKSCEDKLLKAYEQINKQLSPFSSEISKQYYKSKVKELALALEYEEEKKRVKDEQDEIKAQMREEQKELAAAEKARDKAIEEEIKIEEALELAKKEIESKADAEKAEFEEKIKALEAQLAEAHMETERKIANAQITSVGHVYVISNLGSFGEEIYKIGMTRRDEPMDRVKELGDASVPFSFDVHALIYSENARKLEADLHKFFDNSRINMVNKRKEFFNVSLSEVEKACGELGHKVKFTQLADAREWRETLELRDGKKAA